MMKKKLILFAASVPRFTSVHAQHASFTILENDYDISQQATKSYFGGVEPQENGGFEMVNFLPLRHKERKIEPYSFNKDANLTNTLYFFGETPNPNAGLFRVWM